MRTAFFRTLFELTEQDERIVLIVGDLGFSVVERFAERFPNRFINCGVAEQNMIGLAAGMALCGKIVFTYSIGNFPIVRCLEQVRNDVCYQRLPVKIVAVGGGFAYGSLGFSHHATEDLAITRTLPYMTVVAPGDPVEVVQATREIVRHPGPCYLRLGRAGDPIVHSAEIDFEVGKALLVRPGTDLTIMSTGGMLSTAVKVSQELTARDVDVRLLSMHTLKPIDIDAIISAATETGAIVTIEEHSQVGGLGGAVAEVLCDARLAAVPLKRVALPSGFAMVAGSQDFLRAQYGLSKENILRAVEPIVTAAMARKTKTGQRP